MTIAFLDRQANVPDLLGDRYISNLMYIVWLARADLQQAFDLNNEAGQRGYVGWYETSSRREYGLDPQVPSRISAPARSGSAWQRLRTGLEKAAAWHNARSSAAGANLIGYARAELGMGEHVRMTAASMSTTTIPFGVINLGIASLARQSAKLGHGSVVRNARYRTNIFHVNADQILNAYRRLGRAFFQDRRNILYPFWELAKWPDTWVPVLGIFDEIWAPTRFIREAIAARTDIPVHYMPVSVTLPPARHYGRRHFRLPEASFLFLFTFDFLSFIERKNPSGSIRAFKKAFPQEKNVGLVLKVMNTDSAAERWQSMLELIDGDPRIFVLDTTMDRDEVLDLYAVTDCFVSLHRSEGFGRGPAEAMYLGKPVIATNYSGNTDFTRTDNACLVDYVLVPIESGQYVHEHGQVWAEPDIDQAAWYMRKLLSDEPFRRSIALRGQQYVRQCYSADIIGANYRSRLQHFGNT